MEILKRTNIRNNDGICSNSY